MTETKLSKPNPMLKPLKCLDSQIEYYFTPAQKQRDIKSATLNDDLE